MDFFWGINMVSIDSEHVAWIKTSNTTKEDSIFELETKFIAIVPLGEGPGALSFVK